MTIKYVYLDDGDEAESTAYANALTNATPDLQIFHEYPKSFSSQIRQISGRSFSADGLLLDLRLDQTSHEADGERVRADFRAPALAQEIRTRTAEKHHREYPIALLSFDYRLKESYYRDHTSHDLFDIIIVKDELENELIAASYGRQLIALADGYRDIVRIRNAQETRVGWFHHLLGFNDSDEVAFLDPRLVGHFDSAAIKRPAHEYAGFIIRHLLRNRGPLIDDLVLAARLGIDFKASPDFQEMVARLFVDASYRGVFQSGWIRWWAFKVEKTWNEVASDAGPLRAISAVERVRKLKTLTGLRGLVPVQSLNEDYSTRFWTICERLKVPLDPRDGLLLRSTRPFPWYSDQFVSFEAYERRLVDRRDIDPIDHVRLELMKQKRSSR